MKCPLCQGRGTITVVQADTNKEGQRQVDMIGPAIRPCPMGCEAPPPRSPTAAEQAFWGGVAGNRRLTGAEVRIVQGRYSLKDIAERLEGGRPEPLESPPVDDYGTPGTSIDAIKHYKG